MDGPRRIDRWIDREIDSQRRIDRWVGTRQVLVDREQGEVGERPEERQLHGKRMCTHE